MNIEDISEKELIEYSINDKRQYQEMLYLKYADKMFTVCLTYSDNNDEAADILQDSFIKMFKNLHKFKFKGPFEAWLRRIVINTALEHYRKKKRIKENLSVYENYIDHSVDNILEIINAKQLVKLVNDLPKKAAMVLKLYAIEGFKHQEIAKQLNISVGTSKSQLNRARFLLQESLNKLND
ncbi:MAG: sigma-70 family RNA polymerase sigma factor [Bacteroidales bacterium]|nr:sigma-70 family RNA polymerase sigma factor [Bacteroidales bacterium]